MIKETFKDFFKTKFCNERAYINFSPRHFSEMAMPAYENNPHIVKTPINFDEDDIEFLQQFPHQYWMDAKKIRYDMLHDALKDLHEERMGRKDTRIGFDKLKTILKNAIMNQDWESLSNHMNSDVIQKLKVHFSPEQLKKYTPRDIDEEVSKEAWEEVKSKTNRINIPHDDERDFKFNKTIEIDDGKPLVNKKKPITFKAKPFLNRLYHKLERNPGEPHSEDSGLSGVGKYGYDLGLTDEIKNSDERKTRGFNIPDKYSITSAMKDFLNLNQHKMFGDLPDDAKWMPVYNGDGDQMTDEWTTDKATPLMKKYVDAAKSYLASEEGRLDKKNKVKPVDLAERKLIDDIENGLQVNGPPIHGVAPEGLPVKIKVNKKGEKQLQNPPLYLPHVQKDVKINDNGQLRTVKRWVPIVNPGHYFRPLGIKDEDYVKDENGLKQFNADGTPKWNVPDDQLRGYKKEYVNLPPEEYKKGSTGHLTAAMHPNAMSKLSKPLTKGDPEYQEAWKRIFENQEKVSYQGQSGFYKDFLKGVLRCSPWMGQEACGNLSPKIRSMIGQNIENIYSWVIASVLEYRMGDKSLYEAKNRNYYAWHMTAGWGQQWKNKVVGDVSRDQAGDDGSNIGDILDAQASKRQTFNNLVSSDEEEGGSSSAVDNKSKRKFITGDIEQFQLTGSPYSLNSFIKRSLEKAALTDTKNSQIDIQAIQAGNFDINKLKDVITANAQNISTVQDNIRDVLAVIFQKINNTTRNAAEEAAEEQIKDWVKDGALTSTDLVKAFEKDPRVQAQIAPVRGEKEPRGNDVDEALKTFRIDFAKMQSSKNPEQLKSMFLTQPGQKYSNYVHNVIGQKFDAIQGYSPDEYNKILDAVQREADRIFNVKPEDMPKLAAAREIEGRSAADRMKEIMAKRKMGNDAPRVMTNSNIPWTQLKEEKRYVELAHHQEFLKFPTFVAKLLNWFEANKAQVNPRDWESAVASLKNALGQG